MKKKLFISFLVLLVSGTAWIANYVSAEGPILSSDPNVVALKAAKTEPPCYWQSKGKECTKKSSNEMCAACDDDIIITPETPTTTPTED